MPTSTHPVDLLRQQLTALEAAITLAVSDPKKRTVHLLRTSTRRIEAQLALIELLHNLDATPHIRKARRRLAELRRAAGAVRDPDVARDLLKHPGALETGATSPQSEQPPSTASKRTRHLARDAKALRRSLRHGRSAAAEDLVHLLQHRGPALVLALEAVIESLSLSSETRSLSVSPDRLTTLTRTWVSTHLPPEDDLSTDALHGARKVSKLARYMAEASPATTALAQGFESLQQAGGTWHDFLQLRKLARRELGKHSPLTELLSRLTESSLERYQAALDARPPA